MKILVTGGAGFIGSAVIRHLIEQTNHAVINLDKLTYAGNLDSLGEALGSDRYHFEHADIGDREALDRIFRDHRPAAVMHLAAESHVDRSIDRPAEFISTNIVGTYTLLEVVRDYFREVDDGGFRFLHVSTDEVYGDLHGSGDLFTERTPYAPSSPYSASKASSDHLVRAWGRTYGLPVLITNCSNNYGPCQFPEKLIPHMLLNAVAGRPLPVYGDGKQVRDWLYVEDHADALQRVLFQGRVGETYNIGGNNEKENLEVVEMLCELLDELRPSDRLSTIDTYSDLITFVADRPGHDKRYAIDTSKIEGELGWKPTETFGSGLRKTVEWYLDNAGWCERVLSGEHRLDRMGTS